MTATYSELMAQAQALMAQAEAARKAELSTVIADIKTKMRVMGITVDDLGEGKSKSSGKAKPKAEPKFRGPNGELWSGGPGRKPQWVVDAVAAGKNIEEFRI